jgi:hypothetical protein
MSLVQGLVALRSRRLAWVGVALSGLLVAGCRSRFVAATIENDTDHPLQMVELDYPGASFGVSTLAPHGVYSYRFKAIGSGTLALSYSEAGGVAHTATGPEVKDGQGGSLVVSIGERGAVSWKPVLSSR